VNLFFPVVLPNTFFAGLKDGVFFVLPKTGVADFFTLSPNVGVENFLEEKVGVFNFFVPKAFFTLDEIFEELIIVGDATSAIECFALEGSSISTSISSPCKGALMREKKKAN